MIVCKNCGKELVEGHDYCWNCGAKAKWEELNAGASEPKEGYFWPALAAFLFVVLGVPSCLGGECLLLIAASGGTLYRDPRKANPGFGWVALFEGLACLCLFVVLLRWAIRLHRRK